MSQKTKNLKNDDKAGNLISRKKAITNIAGFGVFSAATMLLLMSNTTEQQASPAPSTSPPPPPKKHGL